MSKLKRDYILLSVKWSKDKLIFWGNLSKDEDKRSYSGYTADIRSCERYTYEELKNKSNEFYEYNGEKFYELLRLDSDGTWIINVKDLHKLGSEKLIYFI